MDGHVEPAVAAGDARRRAPGRRTCRSASCRSAGCRRAASSRGDHADVDRRVEHAGADHRHAELSSERDVGSPFGFVDTPPDNATGVTGAVPFTGWALDDIEVTRVMICRARSARKWRRSIRTAAARRRSSWGSRCSSTARGRMCRPPIPTYPLNTTAGWGFMVLTNMLPNQGNGTYRVLHAMRRTGTGTRSCSGRGR